MNFDPSLFGLSFHKFVEAEYATFGTVLAPLLHVASYAVILLVLWRGNRFRRLFTVFFTLEWLFLFGYWGVYAVVYWSQIGVVYLASYIAAPVLLALIAFFWVRELFQNKLDLDFRGVSKWRWLVLPVLLWGFCYPAYVYGQGFSPSINDLLFSYYGLMPCPTTMVVLSLMTLKYPDCNKTLFRLMTAYALIIGTATVLAGWLPDIPFILIGLYALGLIFFHARNGVRTLTA